MFTPPKVEDLKGFSIAGLTDLANMASAEHTSLVASIDRDNPDPAQVTQLEELQAFVAAAAAELKTRQDDAEKLAAASVLAALPTPPAVEEVPAAGDVVTASAAAVAAVADVTATTPAPTPADTVIEASVTAAAAVTPETRRSVQASEVAPYVPAPEMPEGAAAYTIVAAADLGTFPTGTELTYDSIGRAFEDRVRAYPGMLKAGSRAPGYRTQHALAQIRRNFPDTQTVVEGDSHPGAFAKLKNTSDAWGRLSDDKVKEKSLVAAVGFCAPSPPDYSTCSPITTDGLWNGPEMVLRRGGLLHNQGLDFTDFFGGDTVLPIPGYNILTEAQVIADTAKTCVEIPCPTFVDDRLNVAALCLTGSLLQNRGYPEFVAEFVQGAIASMAHLVNREVVNEIETGSTAVIINTVDPWGTDGTVWSQVMAVIDFAATDIRTAYRANRNQPVEFVFPQWLLQAMRSDWLRRNATHTEDLTMAMINGALSARNARVQWIYDWQDAFDPANGLGAIPATNQMGHGTPAFNNPTAVTFLAYLPGTWVLGRQDVIRLDTVYDSTLLAQNQVTQLFMEDGFKPMRMCQISRAYTVNICASGSTGVQRAVACADVTV